MRAHRQILVLNGPGRRITTALVVLLVLSFAYPISSALAEGRVPGENWQRYEDPSQAGFDPSQLEEAREVWESLPSSAFMVVADGAVVASWGDVSRRFKCHSVRKSFLSALYGIYWDRGEIELNKTLADLGIDDQPDSLLETEKTARILDLLKARSGVFHPAAYAGRTDSLPRGSQGPGRYFAYNNWDFNTLAAILQKETGDDVFEAFDRHFAKPLGMTQWRGSDGYYHYERDKSQYPAYPFRLSAQDAARFGLLFARRGVWGDQRILSEHWVRRSSVLYSIDDAVMGYGFMWWVSREPRFERYGMYSALGVGNQMIAVLPEIDVVIVNRANTYDGEGTPLADLLDLIEQVLEARAGSPVKDPNLVLLAADSQDPKITDVPDSALTEFEGIYDYPPAPLGLPARTTVEIRPAEGYLVGTSPVSGTFKLYLQPDGSLHEEDSYERYVPIRNPPDGFAGIADRDAILSGALLSAASTRKRERALELLDLAEEDLWVSSARALVDLLVEQPDSAEQSLGELALSAGAREVESVINQFGYRFLGAGLSADALEIFELNTRIFPDAFNAWDSLGEAHMGLGKDEEAVSAFRHSLELDPENENAKAMIERIRLGQLGKEFEKDLSEMVPALLSEYRVPGAAVAVIREGEVVLTQDFGVRRAGGEAPVDEGTVFQAASLSKPVVAYGAHVLAQDGELDLDRPLSEYLDEPYVEDARLEKITARIVLSHSTGFPNWRPGFGTENARPLEIYFEPGSDFRYSGEGYVYLQQVMETITGEPLDVFLHRAVLQPLGMSRSSFVWHERFEAVFASPHDPEGNPKSKRRPTEPLAAGTLQTTAADYARLLQALLDPVEGVAPLGSATVASMLTKTSNVSDRFGKSLGWSLGWGIETAEEGDYFWQWGNDGPFKAFAAGSLSSGTAVVVLTNGHWGLDVARPIVERVLGQRSFLDFRMVTYRPEKKK